MSIRDWWYNRKAQKVMPLECWIRSRLIMYARKKEADLNMIADALKGASRADVIAMHVSFIGREGY